VNPQAHWKSEYRYELDHAVEARAKGNEGMARVCARRAARILIGEYLTQRGFSNLGTSIYDLLAIFFSLRDLDEQTRQVASHFMVKVDPNHHLPEDIDLISEVQWLAKVLLLEM
jgi:hypothetical protein